MRLTMQQRQAIVAKTASRYQRSSKKEKGSILSELVELTEYSRVYARRVLRQHGQQLKQGKHSLLADVRVHSPRRWAPYYDEQVRTALVKIWRVMDYICGKRLHPALRELVTVLERHNELRCDRLTREKLLQVSAATIDLVPSTIYLISNSFFRLFTLAAIPNRPVPSSNKLAGSEIGLPGISGTFTSSVVPK